jgi:acetylornithine deacetylase
MPTQKRRLVTKSPASLDPLALALALMRIDSTTGREGEVVAYVERLLRARGWRVERIPVDGARADIVASADGAPAVTLSTHLDTVPPFIPPRVAGTILHGRGACDAKGIAAAMICAAERLRTDGVPVALLFVVGEEASHDGAIAANRHPTTSRVLINGEPTGGALALGTKGAMRVVVRTVGKPAHSAYPAMGRSAIDELVGLLHDLPAVPLPEDHLLGATTVNIGYIAGGMADNILAPSAEARLMIRLVSPIPPVLERLREWAGPRATVEVVGIPVPPLRLATLPGYPTDVMAYATDIPRLDRWGTPYLFGPGSIATAHGDDEQVEIAAVLAAVADYERLARLALAPPD